MKEDWGLKKFGDICKYDKQQDHFTELPYVGLEDIESNTTKFLGTLDPITVKSKTFRFDTSHVLYGRLRPYLNKVLVPDFEGHCSTEIFPILPSNKLDRNYLKFWLISDDIVRKLDSTSTGARMPRANMKEVKDFDIPLPPLPEQKRIVSILDEAFEAIVQAMANIERNIENAEELFQSKLNEIFSQRGEGWEEVKLGKVCAYQNGFAFKSKTYRKTGTPLIRIGDIQDGAIDLSNIKYVDENEYDKDLSRYEVIKGDLLIAMSGATTGKIGIVNKEHTFLLNQRVGKFEPGEELNKDFLFYFLSTKIEEALKISAGSAQPNLSTKQIKDFIIPLPSLKEQKTLVNELNELSDHIESIIELYTTKANGLEELKKSILQKAFSGELTANEHVAV